MLPGHIDLLLQITTRLRTRSTRAQGDDQAIRGLLQLLGELFRDQELAEQRGRRARHARPGLRGPAHGARRRRPGDAWPRTSSSARSAGRSLMARVRKAVALLELIQDADADDDRGAGARVPLRPPRPRATSCPGPRRRSRSCAPTTCSATRRRRLQDPVHRRPGVGARARRLWPGAERMSEKSPRGASGS